jgi:hypothetical protein
VIKVPKKQHVLKVAGNFQGLLQEHRVMQDDGSFEAKVAQRPIIIREQLPSSRKLALHHNAILQVISATLDKRIVALIVDNHDGVVRVMDANVFHALFPVQVRFGRVDVASHEKAKEMH